jgi:chemosensory pili system protein ChpA (sensor histidine kinase/response regulator)
MSVASPSPLALVIDDNKQTNDALVQMLRIWDIHALSALGPGLAMKILGEATPSVIFLDLNMPGMDGFEVLAYLRREPRLSGVPVIIVTSDDQPETAQRATAGGAAALILKPIMLDALEVELQKIGIII